MDFTLEALDARVASRAAASPAESYTAKLLSRGVEKCAQKLGEEAVEAVIAATAGHADELAKEAGDVLYHLLVLLRAAGVPLSAVMAELQARTAQSGLAEGEPPPGLTPVPGPKIDLRPYERFSMEEWSRYRDGEAMTLTADDVARLRGLNDPISFEEAEAVYLPLARLISLYVEATQGLHRAATRFLGTEDLRVPYIIGVAGSVAVGKSTTARILRALLQRWKTSPKVDLVTTDGFLYPNAELERRGLMDRKGFPESYDRARLVGFLADLKSGKGDVSVPVYSHLVYDVVPDKEIVIDRPDILIVEGLNILQPGDLPKDGRPIVFASDFLDLSIYIDADENDLRDWFMERFRKLRETAFTDPQSFFHRFAAMSLPEAEAFGLWAWDAINLPNLRDNILPTRSRADLIIRKGKNHAIAEVELRRV